MGLRDVAPFDVREKVLAAPTVEGPLILRATYDFIDEVFRGRHLPRAGGSVARPWPVLSVGRSSRWW